ncbi:hypothetical protein [Shimia sp. MIT1388]|uniref:hypothetical protein n=1 Tax=Shimia sp. MIT1388 TaxID=3096992 RepID=UPI00399B75BC
MIQEDHARLMAYSLQAANGSEEALTAFLQVALQLPPNERMWAVFKFLWPDLQRRAAQASTVSDVVAVFELVHRIMVPLEAQA